MRVGGPGCSNRSRSRAAAGRTAGFRVALVASDNATPQPDGPRGEPTPTREVATASEEKILTDVPYAAV